MAKGYSGQKTKTENVRCNKQLSFRRSAETLVLSNVVCIILFKFSSGMILMYEMSCEGGVHPDCVI